MSLALTVLALGGVILIAALLIGSRSAWERAPGWLWVVMMSTVALFILALLAGVIVATTVD
jgi:hypothetical protein